MYHVHPKTWKLTCQCQEYIQPVSKKDKAEIIYCHCKALVEGFLYKFKKGRSK